MRLHLAAMVAAAAATLAGPGPDRADAQVIHPLGIPSLDAGPIGSPAMGGITVAAAPIADPAPRFPYSYYAAFPAQARQYVPYGPADPFPFYGQPYGKPYDRWTWSAMAGPPSALQRYYYPPLR